eukprot:gnl/MRDRNA2_/MRDRNA2_294357_c0_seq1.p1 gnl/MRDRNA2_/MRDRNA2_294357_c0~~gnl/MRDRNA2_/MRDRNA2_294357_c0_seq1.p1  ORF type:complete len:264 (-),score=18.73 gnl/MRDRNA2_/MRDRNA2_294357_c0_seq1:140-931(-)
MCNTVSLCTLHYFRSAVTKSFANDLPGHYRERVPLTLDSRERALVEQFRRDGFVRIDSWDGLDVQRVRDRTSIHSMLEQGSLLRKLVHGYLNSEEVVFTGVSFLELAHGAPRRKYDNAWWHHDVCAQRLKAFVYMQKVDEFTHPTTIAAGSHKTLWYETTQYFAGHIPGVNKLNESLVLEEYGPKITRMLANAGGGFIFDTNALHAADMGPKHKKREAWILEFDARVHIDKLPQSSRYKPGNILHPLCHSPSYPARTHWKLHS